MKKLMVNIGLFLVASILFIVLSPIGFVYGLITRASFGISAFFMSLAISIDQLGNVFIQYLFDDIMITPNGYRFGVEDETISSALGKNQRDGTLTKLGSVLCKILDAVDKNHCFKSISN